MMKRLNQSSNRRISRINISDFTQKPQRKSFQIIPDSPTRIPDGASLPFPEKIVKPKSLRREHNLSPLNTIESSLFSQKESLKNLELGDDGILQRNPSARKKWKREIIRAKEAPEEAIEFQLVRSSGELSRSRESKRHWNQFALSKKWIEMLVDQQKNSQMLKRAISRLSQSIEQSIHHNSFAKQSRPHQQEVAGRYCPERNTRSGFGNGRAVQAKRMQENPENLQIEHVLNICPLSEKTPEQKTRKVISMRGLSTSGKESAKRDRVNLREILKERVPPVQRNEHDQVPGAYGGYPDKPCKLSKFSGESLIEVPKKKLMKRITFDSSIDESKFQFLRNQSQRNSGRSTQSKRGQHLAGAGLQSGSIFKNLEVDEEDLMKSVKEEKEWGILEPKENLFTLSYENVSDENSPDKSTLAEPLSIEAPNEPLLATKSTCKSIFGAQHDNRNHVFAAFSKNFRSMESNQVPVDLSANLKLNEIKVLKKFLERIDKDAEPMRRGRGGDRETRKNRKMPKTSLFLKKFSEINSRLRNIERETRELTRDKAKQQRKLRKIVQENQKLKQENKHLKGMARIYKEINYFRPKSRRAYDFNSFKANLRRNLDGKDIKITQEDLGKPKLSPKVEEDWKRFLQMKKSNIHKIREKRIRIKAKLGRSAQKEPPEQGEFKRGSQRKMSPVRDAPKEGPIDKKKETGSKRFNLRIFQKGSSDSSDGKNGMSEESPDRARISSPKKRRDEQKNPKKRREPKMAKKSQSDKKAKFIFSRPVQTKKAANRISYTRKKKNLEETIHKKDRVRESKPPNTIAAGIRPNRTQRHKKSNEPVRPRKQLRKIQIERPHRSKLQNHFFKSKRRANSHVQRAGASRKRGGAGRSSFLSRENKPLKSRISVKWLDGKRPRVESRAQKEGKSGESAVDHKFGKALSPAVFDRDRVKIVVVKKKGKKRRMSKCKLRPLVRNVFKSSNDIFSVNREAMKSPPPNSRNLDEELGNSFNFTLGKVSSVSYGASKSRISQNKENLAKEPEKTFDTSFFLEHSYIKMK